MSNPDSTRQLAEPAARYLVSMMWHPHGATWYEAQRWFVRMWGSGDPGAEKEVRSGLEAAVKALAHRPERLEAPETLLPRELAEHWAELIAAALEERRFSAQALAAFMEEFHVPAMLGGQMILADLEVRALERRRIELADMNSSMWQSLRQTGSDRSREERNTMSDHLQQRHQANQADLSLRREASNAHSSARHELRAAEHRLSVLGQQHAAGRRTDAEVEEAREGHRAAAREVKRTKAALDRVDAENAQRKEERRREQRPMDEHRRDVEEAHRASAVVRKEMSELETRKRDLEATGRELRTAYRRQDDFYDQKRDATRQRDQEQRDQEWLQRRQEQRDRDATKAQQLREQALNPPTPPTSTPQSPEVREWLHQLRSLDGWADIVPPQPPGTTPPHFETSGSETSETPATSETPPRGHTDGTAPNEHGPHTLPSDESPAPSSPPASDQVTPPFAAPVPETAPGPAQVDASDTASDTADGTAGETADGTADKEIHDTDGEGYDDSVFDAGVPNLLSMAPRLAKVSATMASEAALFRALPESTSANELSESARRLSATSRQLASLNAEFTGVHQRYTADAEYLQRTVNASFDQLSRILGKATGRSAEYLGLDDVEHSQASLISHQDQLHRSLAANQDVVHAYEELAAAAEHLARSKDTVENAQVVLRQARERNDIDEITAAADLLRRARNAYGDAEMRTETSLATLDHAEEASRRIAEELANEAANAGTPPSPDPDAELLRPQDPRDPPHEDPPGTTAP